MKNKTLVGCVAAAVLAIVCIVGGIFFFFQEENEPESEWSYPIDESKYPYPVLDSNEKLEDLSFGWYRPISPPGGPLKYEFVGQFPKVPDKMLLYKIIRPKNVTEAYVRELAEKKFDMPTDAKLIRSSPRPGGGAALFWIKTDAYLFELDPLTGFFNILKYEKARKKLSEDRKDYPSDEECIKIATEYLKERNLLPEEAYLAGVSDVNIKSGGAISVWFCRKINQYKIWGHGSTISVRIGVAGEITEVSKRWFEYEPYKLAPIKSPKEAVRQYKYGNALLATSIGKATKMELAYHNPANGEYIQPVYSFGFGNKQSYCLVPAIKPEYLKSHDEMWKEDEERQAAREKQRK